jgi:hypothetical protein
VKPDDGVGFERAANFPTISGDSALWGVILANQSFV